MDYWHVADQQGAFGSLEMPRTLYHQMDLMGSSSNVAAAVAADRVGKHQKDCFAVEPLLPFALL